MKTLASVGALAARTVVGGYLAAHGAQKLVGSFGGHGLDATAAGFDKLGLTPGREMATLAGVVEVGGGVLTASGIAHPLGPIAVAGTMAVAAVVHRDGGPFAGSGGYELPVTNLAVALLLATAGPGRLRLGGDLPRSIALAATAGAAAASAVAISKLVARRQSQAAVAEAAPA